MPRRHYAVEESTLINAWSVYAFDSARARDWFVHYTARRHQYHAPRAVLATDRRIRLARLQGMIEDRKT